MDQHLIFFCKNCNKSVPKHHSIQKGRWDFCPTCDKRLHLFRPEQSSLSQDAKIAEKDDISIDTKNSLTKTYTPPILPQHILECEDALSHNPDNTLALEALALFYKKEKNFDKALTYFQHLQHLHPNTLPLYEHIIDCYFLSGQLNHAIKTAEAYHLKDPKNDLILLNLAQLCYETRQLKKACDCLEKICIHSKNEKNVADANTLLSKYREELA